MQPSVTFAKLRQTWIAYQAISTKFSRSLSNKSDPTMPNAKLDQIRNVDIDPQGKFKYILIQVSDPDTKEEKHIVRGYKSCAYHMDIFEAVEPSILKLKCQAKCVGGGRILHKPDVKSIFIYGYSQGYGRADHTIAQKLIKEKYPEYSDISWSNEGY